ncbi:spore protease YyaC [Cohnella endophytica]|uniref:Spore protease YyaC n=1 Tax=Cohnella endophytica TaxID=2419778 RepID=A0A494XDZ3_9BACL|nr:spore protease YyaC [Cohnella endophytica]RKP45823.1 spore protease YyaC [Cohnella endophytica]
MIDRNRHVAECVDEAGLQTFMSRIAEANALEDIAFLCIGTDRSTGDCLGPWVGTMLEERGFANVIGTLREPCDADKLPGLLPTLNRARTIIAVDACLGKPDNVGAYMVREGPLIPARSVNKGFEPVGSYSIAAVVNAVSLKPYWTLQSTSLYRVMGMAGQIADAISLQWRNNNRKDGSI